MNNYLYINGLKTPPSTYKLIIEDVLKHVTALTQVKDQNNFSILHNGTKTSVIYKL